MVPKTVWTRIGLSVGAAVLAAATATGAFGGSGGSRTSAATPAPTLAVAIVGGGRITSTPAGISCPGKCGATFAAGSRVLLTPTSRSGSRFLRWGGGCTGAGACRVRVSALAVVAAQFVGSKAQPTPAPKGSVEPGTYSGSASGRSVTFFVPAGAGTVSNFSSGVNVVCAGGGYYSTPFQILKAPIKPDGSFAATTSQNGVIDGAVAKITYFVTGRFQGRSAAGAAAADGVYRVGIVFTDTPNRKCTSNDQSWTAARSQPPQTKSIAPGTYPGSAGGRSVTFFVPAGAGTVSNFSSGVNVVCAGGGCSAPPSRSRRRRSGLTARSPGRPLRRASSAERTQSSRTSSRGTSRDSTPPGRRVPPGCTAWTSCSPTRPVACARPTTNPGRRLDPARSVPEGVTLSTGAGERARGWSTGDGNPVRLERTGCPLDRLVLLFGKRKLMEANIRQVRCSILVQLVHHAEDHRSSTCSPRSGSRRVLGPSCSSSRAFNVSDRVGERGDAPH